MNDKAIYPSELQQDNQELLVSSTSSNPSESPSSQQLSEGAYSSVLVTSSTSNCNESAELAAGASTSPFGPLSLTQNHSSGSSSEGSSSSSSCSMGGPSASIAAGPTKANESVDNIGDLLSNNERSSSINCVEAGTMRSNAARSSNSITKLNNKIKQTNNAMGVKKTDNHTDLNHRVNNESQSSVEDGLLGANDEDSRKVEPLKINLNRHESVIPKITIKPIVKPVQDAIDGRQSPIPKITIKTSSASFADGANYTNSNSNSSTSSCSSLEQSVFSTPHVVPKLTIRANEVVPKLTIKMDGNMHNDYSSSSSPSPPPPPLPKLTIKTSGDGIAESSLGTAANTTSPVQPSQCHIVGSSSTTSPTVPKLTIKNIHSSSEMSIPKLTIKPVSETNANSSEKTDEEIKVPKMTIKTSQEHAVIIQHNDSAANQIPKMTIKTKSIESHDNESPEKALKSPSTSLLSPSLGDKKLKVRQIESEDSLSVPKLKISLQDNEKLVPKLTINMSRQQIVTDDTDKAAPDANAEKSIPKFTIKTLTNSPESPKLPKLKIKPIEENHIAISSTNSNCVLDSDDNMQIDISLNRQPEAFNNISGETPNIPVTNTARIDTVDLTSSASPSPSPTHRPFDKDPSQPVEPAPAAGNELLMQLLNKTNTFLDYQTTLRNGQPPPAAESSNSSKPEIIDSIEILDSPASSPMPQNGQNSQCAFIDYANSVQVISDSDSLHSSEHQNNNNTALINNLKRHSPEENNVDVNSKITPLKKAKPNESPIEKEPSPRIFESVGDDFVSKNGEKDTVNEFLDILPVKKLETPVKRSRGRPRKGTTPVPTIRRVEVVLKKMDTNDSPKLSRSAALMKRRLATNLVGVESPDGVEKRPTRTPLPRAKPSVQSKRDPVPFREMREDSPIIPEFVEVPNAPDYESDPSSFVTSRSPTPNIDALMSDDRSPERLSDAAVDHSTYSSPPSVAYSPTTPTRGSRGRGRGRGRGSRGGRGATRSARGARSNPPSAPRARCVGGLKHTPNPARLKGLFSPERKKYIESLGAPTPTSSVQLFEEDTRMSADLNTKQPDFLANEDTQSSMVSSISILDESRNTCGSTVKKKKAKMEVTAPEGTEYTVDLIAEYDWPPPKGCCPSKDRDTYMIQEQIAMYLGIKSFKRKYPDLPRRQVDMEERNYLQEKGLVTEKMCDLGITAVWASDVLDIMHSDFYEKYEEYKNYLRQKLLKGMEAKQKQGLSDIVQGKGRGMPPREKAMLSTSQWNCSFNKSRREERTACLDLQNLVIQVPSVRTVNRPDVKKDPKPPVSSNYPIALVPGQFCDYYRNYTPDELKKYPINTVTHGSLPINRGLQPENAIKTEKPDYSSCDSDSGSDSDTDSSSSSSESDSGSSSFSDDDESKMDMKCCVCLQPQNKNQKGIPEMLIRCYTCRRKTHPSCIEIPHRMVARLRNYNWQCEDCKCCIKCKRKQVPNKMLFCEQCDRGYHIYCLGIKSIPDTRWSCPRCCVCMRCGANKPEGHTPTPANTAVKQKKLKWINEYRVDHITKFREHSSILCVPCARQKSNSKKQSPHFLLSPQGSSTNNNSNSSLNCSANHSTEETAQPTTLSLSPAPSVTSPSNNMTTVS